MNDSVVLIGAGGHASVLLEMLVEQGINIIGYVSPKPATNQKLFSQYHWFKSDEDTFTLDKSTIRMVNGIGSLPRDKLRAEIFRKYKDEGFIFKTIISSNAIVSKFAKIHEGGQIFPGAIVNIGAIVGSNSIINSGAIIEHDCIIGDNNHVAPGCTLSGNVHSAENVHFGTNATLIQSIRVGVNSIIGAGAVITTNVDSNTIIYPAKSLAKENK